MTGVEILAMEEVVTEYAWNWDAYFITIFVAVFLGSLVGLACSAPLIRTQDVIIGAIAGTILGVVIGCLPANLTLPSEYETHYKVIVSDEVSMNEFLSKYEIVDQEGKIYTVREIKDDK